MGILSLLLWTPAVGVLLLAFIPGQNTQIIRYYCESVYHRRIFAKLLVSQLV